MGGKLNLPMFLFNVGMLTLMNIDTLIFLALSWITLENNKEDGAIPFLDIIAKPEVDGKLSFNVYRKHTCTDQYLQWDSYHHLTAKFSVIHTLSHRAPNSM